MRSSRRAVGVDDHRVRLNRRQAHPRSACRTISIEVRQDFFSDSLASRKEADEEAADNGGDDRFGFDCVVVA